MFSGIQHIGGGKAERVHGAIRHFYRTDERRVNGRFDDASLLRIDGFSANACRFTGANKGGLKRKKNDYPDDYNEKAEEELTAKQIFMQYVLPNKLLWYIAIANVFVYLLRYGILDWSPTYLKEVKHFALDKSSWAYFLYEYAGIPGTLLCGWMSDKVFRGNRGATGVFFMTLVTIATIVYWMNPAGNPNVDMACMIIIGFLIYGPVMLIGLHALELAPKKAAGTAAGFTGLFGYLGGSVAASAIVGYTVDFFGWDGGFMVMIGGSILAVILLVVVMIGEKRHHDELQLKRNGG